MMRILGIHPSGVPVSLSSALADRFLFRDDGGDDDEGEEEDISTATVHSKAPRERCATTKERWSSA